jgi:hypothetical protein
VRETIDGKRYSGIGPQTAYRSNRAAAHHLGNTAMLLCGLRAAWCRTTARRSRHSKCPDACYQRYCIAKRPDTVPINYAVFWHRKHTFAAAPNTNAGLFVPDLCSIVDTHPDSSNSDSHSSVGNANADFSDHDTNCHLPADKHTRAADHRTNISTANVNINSADSHIHGNIRAANRNIYGYAYGNPYPVSR